MSALEMAVDSEIVRIVKRGPNMRLIETCVELARKDDKRLADTSGDQQYASRAVNDRLAAYLAAFARLSVDVMAARSQLPVAKQEVEEDFNTVTARQGWLATYQRSGNLLEMPGYVSDFLSRAIEHRQAKLQACVNQLLGRAV